VSNIRYYSPKKIPLKGSVPFVYMLVVVGIFAIIFTYPPGILLTIGLIYALSGPAMALHRRHQKQAETTPEA